VGRSDRSAVSDPEDILYAGGELELFRHARNWKAYWSEGVRPFLGRQVLEVGAGIGGNTLLLHDDGADWTCLEPDPELREELERRLREHPATRDCTVLGGTVAGLPADAVYDTVLYIDVLEHIEDDRGEIARVAAHLAPGGHLIVVAPAHEFLFSRFDAEIGHFRRYDRASLTSLASADLQLVRSSYLDSAGILLSLANRFLLRRDMPTSRNVATWDRFVVPVSVRIDPLLAHRVGKTILVVWQKSD
jgi:SAM-dependent methyltransferase